MEGGYINNKVWFDEEVLGGEGGLSITRLGLIEEVAGGRGSMDQYQLCINTKVGVEECYAMEL